METLIRDVRYGARALVREPGFTLLAVLALCIGYRRNDGCVYRGRFGVAASAAL